ncbi:MAG: CehA/McbA family metallohydrolase, partial [bacterium]|nr:CehA/McbA family metallohydrolase [bacterium]
MSTTRLSNLSRLAAVIGFGGLLLIAQRSAEEFTAPGFHRITARLVDRDSGEPLAARVSFTDAAGKYYPPLGHPWRIPAGPWGGDLALPNGENYAYVEGEFEVELPEGEIAVKAVHGLEYDVHESKFEISSAGKDTLAIPLKRWSDIQQRGWMAGDTHIHFPNPRTAMTEMKAEGLNVTNLLVLKGGVGDGERPGDGTFKNVEHFDGKLSPLSTGKHFLYANEEFRNHFLGHLIFLDLKRLIWPVSTGELPENGWGGYALPTHADAAELARRQGALVIWAHFPYPNGECPVDVALGKIDAFDILTTGDPFQLHPTLQRIYRMYGPRVYDMAPIDLYYAYLNCGFRIRATSGSDKMSTKVPMGSARTYVDVGPNRNYPGWIEGIRQGRTFISTGPMIEISVDGKGPGEEISYKASR